MKAKARTLNLSFALLIVSAFSCTECVARVYVSQDKHSGADRRQPVTVSDLLRSKSISPYELARYINEQDTSKERKVDFKSVWNKLKIERDEDGVFDIYTPSFSRWRAEVIEVPSSDEHPDCVVLKIAADGGANRRYLVFKRIASAGSVRGWQFTGHVDHIDHKYEWSEHNRFYRVISNEAGDWLILRALGATGTGVFEIDEYWYKVDAETPRKVLQYPVEFRYSAGFISDLDFEAAMGSPKFVSGPLTQQILYAVSFGLVYEPESHFLFSRKARVTFVWNDEAGKFVFDESQSDVSANEFDDYFGVEDDEKFIRYNFKWLLKVAGDGGDEGRAWFKRVLDKTEDDSLKAMLQRALQP